MTYKLIRFFINLFFRIVARVEYCGMENIPARGGFIGVSNHVGRLEVPLVYYLLNRDDIILLVAEKYRRSAFWRWAVKRLNAMFIDRYNADFTTLRETLTRLKRGDALILAPEGTRSPDGILHEAHWGAAYMASKSGLPVIPVGITGTEDGYVADQFKHFRRIEVRLRVGRPFIIPPLKPAEREEKLKFYTDEIMCQIAAQLPPERWGFYANHPRLKELLAEQAGK
jgi:1-acyl-sn-glycerol-3-phosphate acyltransferase